MRESQLEVQQRIQSRLHWFGSVLAALIVAAIAALWFDTSMAGARSADWVPGDLRRVIGLSEVFAHGFGVAVALILVWTLAPQLRRRMPVLAACAILPGLAVQGIKLVVARQRPLSFEGGLPDSIAETWLGVFPDWQTGSEYVYQSFPSSHTATAVGLAIGLSWLLPRGRYVFCFFAVLGSLQRIVSGAHWTSDVFAGAAVAVAICGIILWLDARKEARRSRVHEPDEPKTPLQRAA